MAWVDDHVEVANDYDGILVLGGGFKSDGTLNTWSQRRLDASVDLQSLQVKPCPIVCLGMVATDTEWIGVLSWCLLSNYAICNDCILNT